MTLTYRTVVLHLPPTPMGLLPERWAVEHHCDVCRRRVTSDQLVDHARGHDRTDDSDGSFPPAPAPSTMSPDSMEPHSAEEVNRD